MRARHLTTAVFISFAPFELIGQALQRGDVTLGITAGSGLRSAVLSRGWMIGGEATVSLSDRHYIRGSGGRMSSTLERPPFVASQTNQFAGAAFGTQFRLQQSLSPFLDCGLVGLWGTGTQKASSVETTNGLEFWQIGIETAGGIRYVRTPTTKWGIILFYRLSIPIRRQETPSDFKLSVLKTAGPHDRAGISFFVRF